MTKHDDVSSPPATPPAIAPPSPGGADPKLRRHLVNQAVASIWKGEDITDEELGRHMEVAAATLDGLKPRDDLEGMLGTQMIATHNAAMTCLQRATINPAYGDRNFIHAAKFLNTYLRQLQLLDRRRGASGQVSVGTVNVESGAQAIVGTVGHVPSRT